MKRRHFLAGSAALTLAAPSVRAAGNPKLLNLIPPSRHRAARSRLHPRPGHAQPRLHGLRHTLWRGRRRIPPRGARKWPRESPAPSPSICATPTTSPRTDGPPSGTAGPKVANFDRVEWHTIPDPATRARRAADEVDWVGAPLIRPRALAAQSQGLKVEVFDKLGSRGDGLQLLSSAVRQRGTPPACCSAAISRTRRMTVVGERRPSGGESASACSRSLRPISSEAGMEALTGPRDIARSNGARRGIRLQGRADRLDGADRPAANNARSEVADALFPMLGLNVRLPRVDWGTMLQRLNRRRCRTRAAGV